MKEIGGYFGLECEYNPLYYEEGIYINSCRNSLRYLIRALGIKKIHIPVFTCAAIEEALKKENCKIIKYNIDESLFPIQNIEITDFVLYNNYFGVTGNKVLEMASTFPNLIVDNAQAFYSLPLGRASIYSIRKFFGVPDGGILMGNDIPLLQLKKGTSYEVMSHLLIRDDLGAQKGFPYFVKDEKIIDSYPLKYISNLTKSLLGNLNYENVKKKRIENFNFLHNLLKTKFPLNINNQEVPLIYPFYCENGEMIRDRLIDNNIFCARYWPNILEDREATSLEIKLAKNIVSLPIDQRYDIKEMEHIKHILDGNIN